MYLRKEFGSDYDTLRRYISYFYQVDLVCRYVKKTDKILEIGVGNKTVNNIVRNKGYTIVTVDILPDLQPDYVADVRMLPFHNDLYDVTLAYEVLEHVPYDDFALCLKELKRVTKKVVFLSLPYWNASFECIIKFPGLGVVKQPPFFRLHLEIPYFFRNIKSKEHYFEIGEKKHSLRSVRKAIKENLGEIVEEFSIPINNHHRFFICTVKEDVSTTTE